MDCFPRRVILIVAGERLSEEFVDCVGSHSSEFRTSRASVKALSLNRGVPRTWGTGPRGKTLYCGQIVPLKQKTRNRPPHAWRAPALRSSGKQVSWTHAAIERKVPSVNGLLATAAMLFLLSVLTVCQTSPPVSDCSTLKYLRHKVSCLCGTVQICTGDICGRPVDYHLDDDITVEL